MTFILCFFFLENTFVLLSCYLRPTFFFFGKAFRVTFFFLKDFRTTLFFGKDLRTTFFFFFLERTFSGWASTLVETRVSLLR